MQPEGSVPCKQQSTLIHKEGQINLNHSTKACLRYVLILPYAREVNILRAVQCYTLNF